MAMTDKKYWVALNMVMGIGKTLFYRLINGLGSPERVFCASRSELKGVEGIGDKAASEILNFDIDKNVEKEFLLLEQTGAKLVTKECSEYPSLLKAIYDPPPVLYYKGTDLNQFPLPIAMVGTRIPSSYGKIVAERLGESLASMGFCIVSGMARGIDTIAHKQALKSGGSTLAVFGCGLGHTYPPENQSLRKKIEENGAVISEFPILMKPDRNNFPARNRVISGLSYGVIVVEAGEKSGALITARFALEQGREVFAVPGNVYSPKSQGTNGLIKMGAKLVDGPESVVEEFSSSIQNLLKSAEKKRFESVSLTSHEKLLMDLITAEEQHIDALIESSHLSPAEVSATLIKLELKELIRQVDGKMFIDNTVKSN